MKNNTHHPFSRILDNQKGVSAILVAILVPVLIGFAALAIDVGYMYTTKNELQNIADAAALAGAGKLGRIYLDLDLVDQPGYTLSSEDETDIREAAQLVAIENNAAGTPIAVRDEDIFIGKWDFTEKTNDPFSEGIIEADAVRVITRRDSDKNNPVSTFFAKIFSFFGGDHDTFDSSALATAALSAPASVEEGELQVPFGISDEWFTTGCPPEVIFKSGEDCAGWHNFLDSPPYSQNGLPSNLGDKMINLIKEHPEGEDWLTDHFGDYGKIDDYVTETSPGASLGTEFYFTEGVSSLITNPNSTNYIQWNDITDPDTGEIISKGTTITGYSAPGKAPAPLSSLFDFHRFRDEDNDDTIWTTTVPVYSGCKPLTGFTEIIGFAEIIIKAVNPPSVSNISVKVTCEFTVIEGRGGGGSEDFGFLKASIPNLVE